MVPASETGAANVQLLENRPSLRLEPRAESHGLHHRISRRERYVWRHADHRMGRRSGPHPRGTRSFRAVSQTRRSRSEEHTSELQSLMRISYAVFCLKKK